LTTACALSIPGVLAIGAVRGGQLLPQSPSVWALLACLHAMSVMGSAVAAVLHGNLKNARARALDEAGNFDAIERLPSGERLLPVLGAKFDLARARRVAPAVLVVHVFNIEAITRTLGTGAADQVTLATLSRIQAGLNPKDAIGRYFDACFVVLIHNDVDTHYLRERCMRLAAQVRRDVALRGATALANDNEPLALDIGVGACWSDQVADMATAMQQAAAAAAHARSHISKASVVIYPGRPPLPVEVVLGGEAVVPHADR
jgi:GGDEF domain-containing protein